MQLATITWRPFASNANAPTVVHGHKRTRRSSGNVLSRLLRPVLIGLMLCLNTGLITSAYAHAELAQSIPPAGGTVSASPKTLTLAFTEAAVPYFSAVQVRDSHGTIIAVGKLQAKSDLELIVSLPPLSAGSYAVIWHVTSEDTHKTQGRFTFTVTQ